jgi:hypothetical protein
MGAKLSSWRKVDLEATSTPIASSIWRLLGCWK